MFTTRTLLIFDLDDTRFGVDATLVRETIWLPEMTPIEEAPPYIVGVFSLHGQIVPVTDLNLRFGHPARPYRLSDQIVILELDQLLMGIIVSEVIEVITVEGGIGNAECGMIMQSDSLQSVFSNQHSAFEMVRVGDDIVTLLDAHQLVHVPDRPHPNLPPPVCRDEHGTGRQAEEMPTPPSQIPLATLSPCASGGRSNTSSLARSTGEAWPVLSLSKEGGGSGTEPTSPSHHFCPEATPEQHAEFRARARALMESIAGGEGALLALAVVELGGEYFGIELHSIQEFCNINRPYPIPCCPPHILGAISLRGNLLALLDLRAALNLPRAIQNSGKAMIVRAANWQGTGSGEQAVGVAVDDVHDVVYLREEELYAAPATLREQHGAEIKGVMPYCGKIMAVLNLPVLLARKEWIVNETV